MADAGRPGLAALLLIHRLATAYALQAAEQTWRALFMRRRLRGTATAAGYGPSAHADCLEVTRESRQRRAGGVTRVVTTTMTTTAA